MDMDIVSYVTYSIDILMYILLVAMLHTLLMYILAVATSYQLN